MLGLLVLLVSTAEAVVLTGSSEYAVPGDDFAWTCDVPEEANSVQLYRRSSVGPTINVGAIQVVGDTQCYSMLGVTPGLIQDLCTPGVCSCQLSRSRTNYGTSFQWVIQPRAGSHSSVWYCSAINPGTGQVVDSPDVTLKVADHTTCSARQHKCDSGICIPANWTCDHDNDCLDHSPGELSSDERNCSPVFPVFTYVPVTSVQLLNPPSGGQPIDVTENQSTNLVCVTSACRPSASVLWLVGETNYTPSSVPNVSSVAGDLFITTSTMTFTPTKAMAGQKVLCMTYNIGNLVNATLQTTLNVRYPPTILSLTYTSGGADVAENGDTSLMCTVESYPASTIQWYYKANNTQLLSTPDTLESTYTLTGAGCLDTGVYTCSVSNSEAITPVTRDISVNVLCKPRQDFRLDLPLKYGLGLGDIVTIPASFISNPEPSYKWMFQNSSLSAVEDLIDGKDNFAIHNNYNENPLSGVSTGTRRRLQERWFGFYIVTATNNHGSATTNYTVEAKAEPVPDTPPLGAIIGAVAGSAVAVIAIIVIIIAAKRRRMHGKGICIDGFCKRKETESPDVPLDNLRHSYDNVDVAQQGPVSIDTSDYEQMQPRDPPSVYEELSIARQGNGYSDDGNNYEYLGRCRSNLYEELKGSPAVVYENPGSKRK